LPPGWYWSSTLARLLAYESRLELARIMMADFDPSVTGMARTGMYPERLLGPRSGGSAEGGRFHASPSI
jgi:hypothetical protein